MRQVTALLLLATAFTLAACGGGSSDQTSSEQNTTADTSYPHKVTNTDMKSVNMLSRTSINAPRVSFSENQLHITQTVADMDTDEHYQIYLNLDNDASTGYNFSYLGWDKTGADYIVEDGDLFKSLANDDSWNWDTDAGAITSSRTADTISVSIPRTLLTTLHTQIRVGLMIRNHDWSIRTMFPQANLMEQYSLDIDPPEDTEAPVITLNGSQTLSVMVSDAAGNTAEKQRTVIVTPLPTGDIQIDGNTDDWAAINAITDSTEGQIKVTDTEDTLYLLIEPNQIGVHTQIFIDTDNDAATGYLFTGHIWNSVGADYMIEDTDLSKAQGDGGWSWDYGVATIEFVKTNSIIEVAIPKSALHNLGDTVNIGFIARARNWSAELALPGDGLASYSLQQTAPESGEVVLLPGLCSGGNIWLSDGTASNTAKTPLSDFTQIKKHDHHIWYGVSGGNSIIKYDRTGAPSIGGPNSSITEIVSSADTIRSFDLVGDKLYFITNAELWVVNTDGSNVHKVATGSNRVTKLIATENYLFITSYNSSGGGGRVNLYYQQRVDNDGTVRDITTRHFHSTGSLHTVGNDLIYFFRGGFIYRLDMGNLTKSRFPYSVSDYLRWAGARQDTIFYSIQADNKFELWSHSPEGDNKIEIFDQRPEVRSSSPSTSNLYVRTYQSMQQSVWKISNGNKVLLDTVSSRDGEKITGVYQIANSDYIAYYERPLNHESISLKKVGETTSLISGSLTYNDSGDNGIDSRPQFKYINNVLYFTALEDDTDSTSRYIGVIDNHTAQLKKLASCN